MGTANSMIGTPILQPATAPYDAFKDFTPISQMGLFTLVLVVAPELPVNTLADFVAYVRERPGKLNYASSNPTDVRLAATTPQEMASIHRREYDVFRKAVQEGGKFD